MWGVPWGGRCGQRGGGGAPTNVAQYAPDCGRRRAPAREGCLADQPHLLEVQ